MILHKKSVFVAAQAFLLFAGCPAHAQVASLGKGWALCSSSASITSAPSEVISGRNSIKGAGEAGQLILCSDPLYVPFAANQTYTLTWNYRIITSSPGGFGYGFGSPEGQRAGDFGPGGNLQGSSGSSGSVTNTWTLGSHADYSITFALGGAGVIVIDDIRVTDAHGTVVASENAEGPTLASGPLNFQLTDAAVLLPDANSSLRSAAAYDLNGDGYPEIVLTFTAPRPSTTPIPPLVIEASAHMRLATNDFFPEGPPTVKHSPTTLFVDINNDGLKDLVFADAGSDAPPGLGSAIGVALNLGGGKFRNVQPLVPADTWATRSYAVTAGDIYGDGRVEIILPDQGRGQNTSLLRWNGGGFDEIRNWIPQSLWTGSQDGGPINLMFQNWMVLADLDLDGKQDLVVGALALPPNVRIVFGGKGGFESASVAGNLVTLPDGVFGHQAGAPSAPVVSGADVGPVIVADFNNDGLPDIFAIEQENLHYQTGGDDYGDIAFQVFINQGARKFADVTSTSSALKLGLGRYYDAAMPIDMNNDGFLDVVGLYAQPFHGWGTTFFLNDGTGAFQVVDGAELVGATTTPSNGQRWNLGSFLPTIVTRHRTEGIVVEMVGQCGGLGFCSSTSGHLNLYKIVADGSLGTGPNFVDPATLGAPGFNEFYYLRVHPDVADLVRGGTYSSGLDHYLKVGRGAGYQAFAQHATAWGGATGAAVILYGANTYHCGAAGDTVQVTGGTNVIYSGSGNDVISGGKGSDVIVYAGPRNRYRITRNADGSTTVVDSLPGGDGTDTISGTFSLRFADSTITVGPSLGAVPIVLSTAGLNGSFFTSELALTNRGSTDASVTYAYTAAFGGSSGSAVDAVEAGQQKVIPDAIAYLRGLGIPVGESGNRGGTLQITFNGLSSPDAGAATVRTTSAVPEGRAGLAYSGVPPTGLLSSSVYLCGLRQNLTDRSNVALIHAGSSTDGNITLRLVVFSGDPANPQSQVLPEITLAPGGFSQVSGILASNGLNLTNGYVRVDVVSGTAPYYAYAVVNDQANSDGSFVEPILASPATAIARLTLPVLVETSTFSSELALTNVTSNRRTLHCTYVATALPTGSLSFDLSLAPHEQQILPAFVQVLRNRGVLSGSAGATFAGALFVADDTGDLRGISIGARVSTAGGGGRYGLFYQAVPNGSEATTGAWLYGLQQNSENRTNLALLNVGSVDGTADVLHIDLYDGSTGQIAGSTDVTVPARGFLQLNAIMSQYAPGTTQGYARVTRPSGNNPFIAYAVVNDGAQPGQRSGDGAFVKMVPE